MFLVAVRLCSRLAGRGNHFTKGQQAAIRSMVQYAKGKGAASPVSVKVLGVSKAAVYRVMAKQVASPKKRARPTGKYKFHRVDDFQRKIIQRVIYAKYTKNEVPTVPQLQQELIEKDINFNYSVRHLRRLLKVIGFSFKKLDRRGRVLLSTRITILRNRYIHKMQQMRAEGRPLVFVDETWKKCAIILDNASYHSRMLNKTPSMTMKKNDIVETLQRLRIPIPSTVIGQNNKPRNPTKADLLQIYKNAGVEKQYCINKLAENKGHEVMKLPPYYCIFNPIELIWAALKKEVRLRNTSPSLSVGVIKHVRAATEQITEELWRKCCTHSRKEEVKYLSASTVPPFVISLEDEEEDDTSDEEEEENLDLGCTELAD